MSQRRSIGDRNAMRLIFSAGDRTKRRYTGAPNHITDTAKSGIQGW